MGELNIRTLASSLWILGASAFAIELPKISMPSRPKVIRPWVAKRQKAVSALSQKVCHDSFQKIVGAPPPLPHSTSMGLADPFGDMRISASSHPGSHRRGSTPPPPPASLSLRQIPQNGRLESAQIDPRTLQTLDRGDPVSLKMRINGTTYKDPATMIGVMHMAKGDLRPSVARAKVLLLDRHDVEHYVPLNSLDIRLQHGDRATAREDLLRRSRKQFLQCSAQPSGGGPQCVPHTLQRNHAAAAMQDPSVASEVPATQRSLDSEPAAIRAIYARTSAPGQAVPETRQTLQDLASRDRHGSRPGRIGPFTRQHKLVNDAHPAPTHMTDSPKEVAEALRRGDQVMVYTPTSVNHFNDTPNRRALAPYRTNYGTPFTVAQVDYRENPFAATDPSVSIKTTRGYIPPKVSDSPDRLQPNGGHARAIALVVHPRSNSAQAQFIRDNRALWRRFDVRSPSDSIKPVFVIADPAKYEAPLLPGSLVPERELALPYMRPASDFRPVAFVPKNNSQSSRFLQEEGNRAGSHSIFHVLEAPTVSSTDSSSVTSSEPSRRNRRR
jgi:hypothetical protein